MKDLNDIQSYVFVCIISADNDEFGLTEDQKQEILHREKESDDWSYILECMPEDVKGGLIKFFTHEESIQEHSSNAGSCRTSNKTLEPSEESPKEC